MSKQIHISVDDQIYNELSQYSIENRQSIQDSLSVAIRQLLIKRKKKLRLISQNILL